MKRDLIFTVMLCVISALITACGQPENNKTADSFEPIAWQEEVVDYEALSKWQLLGSGSVSPNMNVQTSLMESDNSQGVMLLSPKYYDGDVIVKCKTLALTSASVFVIILSATDTLAHSLNILQDYDGGMGLWVNGTANYFIAFKNASHGATPFIVKNPGYVMAAKATEQDKMVAGVYYDIEVGKEGGNIWLSIDGEKVTSWQDPSPLKGGHISLRLRGTAGLKAAGLIKDLKIYHKNNVR